METIEALEAELKSRAYLLTLPRRAECSLCYVARMLGEFGCSNHLRWAGNYVRYAAPRVMKFEERLRGRGAFCDCEIFFNAYEPVAWMLDTDDGALQGQPICCCLGARRGSTKPCGHWRPRSRG